LTAVLARGGSAVKKGSEASMCKRGRHVLEAPLFSCRQLRSKLENRHTFSSIYLIEGERAGRVGKNEGRAGRSRV